MESTYILIMGIAIGFVLASKPDALRNLPAKQFSYVLLGLAAFGATFLLGWPGFACVMTAVVLYLVFGSESGSSAVKSFFSPITGSIKWLKEKFAKPKTAAESGTSNVTSHQERQIINSADDWTYSDAKPTESEAVRSDREAFLENQQTQENLERLDNLVKDKPVHGEEDPRLFG